MDKLAGINTFKFHQRLKQQLERLLAVSWKLLLLFSRLFPKFYGQTMNDITSGRIKTKHGTEKDRRTCS